MSLFLRLLEDEDKGAALEAAVRAVACGERNGRVFDAPPESFEQIPGAPFAYWVSSRVRNAFIRLTPLHGGLGEVWSTNPLNADFRYARVWWECSAKKRNEWVPWAKGGSFSPYYYDIETVIHWQPSRNSYYGFLGTVNRPLERPASLQHFFRPGLAWPRRTNGLSFRAMPSGCIFADKGPAAFVADDSLPSLLALLAVVNSAPFRKLVELQLARTELAQSFEVGLIQQTPVPDLAEPDRDALAALSRRAWSLKRELDTAELTSHAFVLLALLQTEGATLAERAQAWSDRASTTEATLAEIQAEIDERCFDLYGFAPEDRAAALGGQTGASETEGAGDEDDDEGEAPGASVDPGKLSAELLDWLVGAAFGRFDVRLATGGREPPPDPEPFDPLPVCSPGMLTGEDGLPLAEAPAGYPIPFPADGILVDDPGLDDGVPADRDLVVRIQQVLEWIWGAQAPEIEQELCGLLGVRDLRTYLRRPAGYFADHVGRWSKSRRKAPIFWPLSTPSGSWTALLYYLRLTADTLYRLVDGQVSPKISEVETRMTQLAGEQEKAEGREASRIAKQLATLTELLDELKAMRAELLRVAALPYRPSLDDGVQIKGLPVLGELTQLHLDNTARAPWSPP